MSLANKLSIYITLVIIAIFCAIGAVFLRYGAEREERLVSAYATLLVNNSVDKLDNDISRIEYHLANSASIIEKHLSVPSSLMPLIERIVATDSLIMGSCVALCPATAGNTSNSMRMEYVSRGPNGELLQKHLDNGSYDYTRMSWYTDVLHADTAVWSDPYFDKGGGNEMMVTCSYPLHNDAGETVAVLTADVSLSELSKEVARLRPIEDSYTFILSNKGLFISHPDSTLILKKDIGKYSQETGCVHIAEIGKEMLARKKGVRHTDISGEDALVVYQPIPGTGWSICCVSPYSSIMSRLDLVTVKAVIFLFLGLLIMIILIRFVVLYSMKPLSRLTEAASDISKGNLHVRLPEMKPSDDIGRLNNAFAEMQKSLRMQMQRLVETTKAKEHIESELHIARSIQMSLLPHSFSPFPQCDALELYAMIRPAKEVGGDLYDFFIRDSKLFFTIGDVSGKGIPASLFMAVTRTLFRNMADRCGSPAEIVSTLNNTILKDNDTCMFVTMFVGILDLKTGQLIFCNAGHNPPVLIGSQGAEMLRVKENIPVGVMDNFIYEEESLTLTSEQSLFLYTDGLTEAENIEKKLYGDDRLLSLLSGSLRLTPKDIIARVESSVDDFADGVDQSDDLTMLCFRLDYGNTGILRKVFANSMSVVSELPAYTELLAQYFHIDHDSCSRINLVLEEAIVNVINYAYPDDVAGEIELTADYDKESGKLLLTISDSGKPFNPLQTPTPDLNASPEERPLGGLGIYLMRTLADNVEYVHIDNRNILKITFLTNK